MIFLRSALYNIFYITWTLGLSVILLPILLSRMITDRVVTAWSWSLILMLRLLCGISYEIRGRENLTSKPVIYASKHQSAFDIFILVVLLRRPAFVLKKELYAIPLIGWYMRRLNNIPLDRGKGAAAMKRLLTAARNALHEHRPLVIYPEGTRRRAGDPPRYLPGVAMLYNHLLVPVVPVALNSGAHWGRNAFLKKPGTIVIEFLPAIAPGALSAREFMATLEQTIETASAKLLAEAG